MKWIMIVALALAGCAKDYGVASTGPWTDFYNEPRADGIPKDVRVFVIRAQGCAHFSGEDGYDAERTAYLKKAMDEMCPGLNAQRIRLLARYADAPEVAALIAEVTEGYSFP